MRRVSLQVDVWQAEGLETVAKLGGLGPKHIHGHILTEGEPDDVIVETLDKVWIPDPGYQNGERGSWKQETIFTGAFTITCPPSFDTSTMCVEVCVLLHGADAFELIWMLPSSTFCP